MKKILLASATALTMMAAPATAQVAQDAPLGSTNSVTDERMPMTERQRAIYDALHPDNRIVFDEWTPDQQVLYFGWDAALRDYYWSLDESEKDAWWYLDGEQQIALYQLQGEQRDQAWNSIMTQVAELEQDRAMPPASGREQADMQFTSNAIVQQVPTHEGEYPVCDSEADDHCINPWAAGERGPGATRPLDYWPGQSASDAQLGG